MDWTEKRDGNGQKMGGPAGGSGASGGTDRRAFLYGRGGNYTGDDNNGTLTVSGTVEGSVGGWYRVSGDAANGSVTAENKAKIINGNIFGGYTHDGNASGNTAALTGTWVKGGPDGDYSTGAVFGGYTDRGNAKGNTLTINEYSTIDFQAVGGQTYDGSADNNEVRIDTSFIGRDPRDLSEEEIAQAPDAVNGGSGDSASDNKVEMTDSMSWGRVTGGAAFTGEANVNRVTISGGHVVSVAGAASVMGGLSNGGDVRENHVTIQNGQKGAEVEYSVMGGYTLRGNAAGNTVTVSDETLRDEEGTRVHGGLYGGLTEWGNADGNSVTVTNVILDGKNLTDVGNGTDAIYGGRTENGNASGNTVTLFGDANVSEAALYGWKLTDEKGGAPAKTADNDLIIDDWTGATQSVKHFDTIRFQGVAWDPGGTLLTITNGAEGDLENTKIDAGHVVILGGRTPQVGESMTFVTSGNVDTGLSEEQAAGGFTQGVVTAGTAEWDMPEAGKTLNYKITGVFRNAQTDAVAENRLAGAAFVNQGADIAADSLHLLDDGYHWGTRTFGAVYGNRSTYDAAGDFKINGWSTIVGAGNVHEVKGGRLAWGVFYENGTGNYRTWNEFNNEMFRGDGSLLYNGGGAAVRLTKDSGMYYEASLRAGTLSSSMTDAVRDGYGNSYGFDSDSTYWGGHIGAGKLIESGHGEWDIYGKYFHTEIDGDSFAMGGDVFSFDSVTSDRLRLGARYTAEKGRAWSLYYGAAYEYEFSGDSRMKAGPWDTEQSLQGSTVFGEIGAVMREGDSPWSVDINLRGYAGEREGFSSMVMAAYSF